MVIQGYFPIQIIPQSSKLTDSGGHGYYGCFST